MNPQQQQSLERWEVRTMAALALAAVYLLAWPAFRPWDEHGAVAFVAFGDFGRLVLLAVLAAVLAGASALLTLQRAEAALLATLIGLAGLSFRSGMMRTILWRFDDHFRPVYLSMAAETLLLLVLLAGAAVIIWLLPGPYGLFGQDGSGRTSRTTPMPAAGAGVGGVAWVAQGLAKSGHGWLILPACRGAGIGYRHGAVGRVLQVARTRPSGLCRGGEFSAGGAGYPPVAAAAADAALLAGADAAGGGPVFVRAGFLRGGHRPGLAAGGNGRAIAADAGGVADRLDDARRRRGRGRLLDLPAHPPRPAKPTTPAGGRMNRFAISDLRFSI